MENIVAFFGFVIIASLVLLVIGLRNPKKAIFWDKENATRTKVVLYFGSAFVISVLIGGPLGKNIKRDKEPANKETTNPTVQKTEEPTKSKPKTPEELRAEEAKKKYDDSLQKELDKAEAEMAEEREKLKLANERKEKIKLSFSPWDGSHIGLTRLIKKNMNDPSSYEHVETSYDEFEDYLIILTRYRGKNGFGAKVLAYVKAKVDLEGNVLQVIEQS